MLPTVDRTPEQLNEALLNRVENLASDLLMLSGITKRGAVLPDDYDRRALSAMRGLAMSVFDALEKGVPATHPWDRQTGFATGSGEN